MKCCQCEVALSAADGYIEQVILGQPDSKRVSVNSPHFVCPQCRLQVLAIGQADELQRRVNLALYGCYEILVRGVPFAAPVQDYLRSDEPGPFQFRVANLSLLRQGQTNQP